MKKATALALAGLMAASAAHASMARWGGFGDSAKFVGDVQDMWTLPEVVAGNPDTTYFEFGKMSSTAGVNVGNSQGYNNGLAFANNAWGGNHMKLGGGVLALWYSRPFGKLANLSNGGTTSANYTVTAGGLTSTYADPVGTLAFGPTAFNAPQNQIDAVYAFNAGAAAIGVGLTYASNNTKTENTTAPGTATTSNNAGDFGISLGAGFKDMGALKTLDAGIQFDMPSAQQTSKSNTGVVDDKITASGSEIDLRVSADMGGKDTMNVVDLIVGIQSMGVKAEPKTAPVLANQYMENKQSYMDINLGWAMGMSNDKGMGLGGFILDYNTFSRDQVNKTLAQQADKADVSVLGIKAVSGGETKVREWLTLRMAISGLLYYSKSTTVDQSPNGGTNKATVSTSTPNAANNPAAITVGTSITLGSVVIDGVANQDMLYAGPFLVSGVPNGLSTQVSATWGWGGSKE